MRLSDEDSRGVISQFSSEAAASLTADGAVTIYGMAVGTMATLPRRRVARWDATCQQQQNTPRARRVRVERQRVSCHAPRPRPPGGASSLVGGGRGGGLEPRWVHHMVPDLPRSPHAVAAGLY